MAEQTKRSPLVKVLTPKGIAIYPWLNKPDTKFNPEGEYRIRIKLTAEEAQPIMDKLEEAAAKAVVDATAELNEKIATEKGEKLVKAKKALKELKIGDLPAKPDYDDEGNETGYVVINFKLKATRKDKEGNPVKQSPKLFDAAGAELSKSADIWGGSEVKVAGVVNPFYMAATNTVGVSLRLNAVQVLKLSSGNSGDADSFGFGKEDGYRTEMSDAMDEDVAEGAKAPAADADHEDF